MSTMNVLDSGGSVVAVEKPLPPGRAAAVASRPVVLSTEDLAALTQAQAGTRVEGTITAGGTAQPLFGVTPVSGFEVINTHASEILYIRENGTASGAAAVSVVPPRSWLAAVAVKAAYLKGMCLRLVLPKPSRLVQAARLAPTPAAKAEQGERPLSALGARRQAASGALAGPQAASFLEIKAGPGLVATSI
jgi:hypothetical protein